MEIIIRNNHLDSILCLGFIVKLLSNYCNTSYLTLRDLVELRTIFVVRFYLVAVLGYIVTRLVPSVAFRFLNILNSRDIIAVSFHRFQYPSGIGL